MGHLVGDFLLQTSVMAYNKKIYFLPCFTHCFIYTLAVSIALVICPTINTVSISLMFWIFMSHWILDRYEFVDWWFKKLNVRSWNSIDANLEDSAEVHHAITISFGSLVYTAADNTLHLIMMTGLLYWYY
jgi:hypothetical protein